MVHKFLAKFSILLHVCATYCDSIPPFCLFCAPNSLGHKQICIIEPPVDFSTGVALGLVIDYLPLYARTASQ